MKLCLINPKLPPSLWDFAHSRALEGSAFPFPPLALATVAALTPSHHEVRILDENIAELDFNLESDLVGITGYELQRERAFEIADTLRARGMRVALGGPMVSSQSLEECASHADAVFLGEAEYTWPKFLGDLEAGSPLTKYLQTALIDMQDSPLPRFDLMDLRSYSTSIIETSRGCPHSCEFCEIPIRLGRKLRAKSTGQVMAEVRALHALGADSLFIVDDNLLGSRARALEIAEALGEFQAEAGYPMSVSCQFTIDTARDTEVLVALRKANVTRVFVGIETPDKEALASLGKSQNTRVELAEAVRGIEAHNIIVWGSFILGLDTDDREVFEEHLRLMESACIPVAMVGLLQALPGTPLYERMEREGRLKSSSEAGGIRSGKKSMLSTNITPKLMSETELIEGYREHVRRLYDYDAFGQRLVCALELGDEARVNPTRRKPGLKEAMALLRTAAYYLFTVEPGRIRLFFRVMAHAIVNHPRRLEAAVMHLIVYKHLRSFYRG